MKGIYYGAYEARTGNNIASIFNMLDAYSVLQWANAALNFIPVVQWYINHDMPAEAISMLKEGICTYLIVEAKADFKNPYLRLVLGMILITVVLWNRLEIRKICRTK